MFKKLLIPILALTFFTNLAAQPVELGKVDWSRDHQEALRASEKSGIPVLILFQEVPGCGTCTGYGKDVLSHPLVVEAIESPRQVKMYRKYKNDPTAEERWNNVWVLE